MELDKFFFLFFAITINKYVKLKGEWQILFNKSQIQTLGF